MTSTPNRDDQHPQAWPGVLLRGLQVSPGENGAGTYWLEQDGGKEEPELLEIHPDQVLYLAQKMGVVRELSQDEAARHEALQVRIRELERDQRRLRLALLFAKDQTEFLYGQLKVVDGMGHEDLTGEMMQCGGITDALKLVVDDFELGFERWPAEVAARKLVAGVTLATELQREQPVAGNAPVTPAPLPAAQARTPGPARAAVVPPPTPGAPGLFDGGPA